MQKENFITSENFKQYRQAMAKYALDYRLSNYGYDYKTFRQMSANKSRLNRKIRDMIDCSVFSNDYHGIYSRFYFPANSDQINYCTGQSMNEEMITVLECLTGKYNE